MQPISAKKTNELYEANLLEILQIWSQRQPDQTALIHLADGDNIGTQLNYAQLIQRIETLTMQLLQHARPGECAVLCIDNEAEFLLAMLACFRAKIIAIPSLTPNNDRAIKRIEAHLLDSGATVVLFDNQAVKQLRVKHYQGPLTDTQSVNVDELRDRSTVESSALPQLAGDDIAYLQYTSGSTREPRGVMITHGNLMAQERMLSSSLGLNPQGVIVNWMPLHHDFGLVTSLLALFAGGCCVLLPPVRVVQQPIRWLRAIDRFRAATSAGAVFMFDWCTRKIQPEQCNGLDLSHWQQVIIGAEPIHAAIVQQFRAAFKDYGFRSHAIWPAYGMAEATLVITLKHGDEPVIRGFDASALQQRRVCANANGHALVSSGQPSFADSVRIVDPETGVECPADGIGELWVKNPCVGKGYWRHTDVSHATFDAWLSETGEGPFLRTGDLAFIHEQEVFITGRIKDTIIINGENRYPQDIEWAMNDCHPALEPGACVAIGVDVDGVERLTIIAEIKRTARNQLAVEEIASAIRAAVVKQQEIDVHTVVLIQPASLPKTSSGKVQRQTCKRRLSANDLPILAVWSIAKPVQPTASSDSEALLDLCRTILKDPSIGPDHDLFARGADSIKSMELIAEIEARWQCNIDLVRFNQQPTVNGLMALMANAQDSTEAATQYTLASDAKTKNRSIAYFPALAEEHRHKLLAYTSAWQADWISPKRLIFGLNTQGAKPPLIWCFQGVHEFAQMARYLGPDQPLYGLRSGHLVIDYTDKKAITALAGQYLEEILTELPQEAYSLGGNCQAGVLATRMAKMLYGLGGQVRRLFILENIVPRVDACALPFEIALFYGRNSPDINPYQQFPAPDSAWKKLYPLGCSIDIINGEHGQFFDEPVIMDFANKLSQRLRESQMPESLPILPETAFSAVISAYPPAKWLAGEAVMIRVTIKNTSTLPWPVQAGLIVANHWLDTDEQPLQWLDGYVPITETVLPGREIILNLPVTVPRNPGVYLLEIDLAEQGVVWFKEKANLAYRLNFDVERPPIS